MLLSQFHVRTLSGFRVLRDESDSNTNGFNITRLIPNSNMGFSSIHFRLKTNSQFGDRKLFTVSCNSSSGSPFNSDRSTNIPDDDHDHDHDFLPASILLSETAIHHRMRVKGFEEETTWRLPGRWNPYEAITRQSRSDSSFVGHEYLRRFQSPTIFLKISCDGEFLLPIIVGEFAIEKLLDTFQSKKDEGDCPDQFHLARNLVEKFGYKVKMVKINARVVNTYYARVFLNKPGENEILSIDARPSDALNMANRCQAPLHVSKQIVFTEAIRISYGIDKKPTYDVSLDSVDDGPDILSEEVDLVKNMNLAVKDERYSEAAMWRDRLMELRHTRSGINYK